MNIIESTKELGKNIQNDELYIKLQMLERACEEDEEIQNLLGELNLKRLAVHNEAQKEERDEDKIVALTEEHQKILDALLANEKMKEYNATKDEFDKMVKYMNGIISGCADGNDPDGYDDDYENSTCGSCSSGGCAGCSGCR
ncbi:YlbF family regulator [Scatolibacter rhodanostii]|uniref:YlbF family regulator n=1 Tax=Scatolibacter rhodanostii TaxID=2014781 RepID=UPI000C08984E|nr:YlbF family regulator [Scatolibacter rhodanostii]